MNLFPCKIHEWIVEAKNILFSKQKNIDVFTFTRGLRSGLNEEVKSCQVSRSGEGKTKREREREREMLKTPEDQKNTLSKDNKSHSLKIMHVVLYFLVEMI